jgi:hypothetical protein
MILQHLCILQSFYGLVNIMLDSLVFFHCCFVFVKSVANWAQELLSLITPMLILYMSFQAGRMDEFETELALLF